MYITKQIEEYFNYLNSNKEQLVVKTDVKKFISESKNFILFNKRNELELLFRVSTSQRKIKLEQFILLSDFHSFILFLEQILNSLKQYCFKIKRNLLKLNKSIIIEPNLLKGKSRKLLKKIDTEMFVNDSLSKDDDYIYVSNRLMDNGNSLTTIVKELYEIRDSNIKKLFNYK